MGQFPNQLRITRTFNDWIADHGDARLYWSRELQNSIDQRNAVEEKINALEEKFTELEPYAQDDEGETEAGRAIRNQIDTIKADLDVEVWERIASFNKNSPDDLKDYIRAQRDAAYIRQYEANTRLSEIDLTDESFNDMDIEDLREAQQRAANNLDETRERAAAVDLDNINNEAATVSNLISSHHFDLARDLQQEAADRQQNAAANAAGLQRQPFQEPQAVAYNAELPPREAGETRQDPQTAREFAAPAADGSPPDYSDPSFSNEERLASLKERFPGFNEEDLKRFQEPEKYKELWLAADNRDRHHASEDAAAVAAPAEPAPPEQPVDWKGEDFADLEQRRQAVEQRFGESSAEFKDVAAADHGRFAQLMEHQDELDERRAAEEPKEEEADAPTVIEPVRRPEDDDDAPSI